MFIYRVWALFVIAHVHAASSSSQKTTSVLGTSKLTNTKIERRTAGLQQMASQPVPVISPVSPDGPLVSPAIKRAASIYSASAPAGAIDIASPRRLDFTGFGCAIKIESELSHSVCVPHLNSTRKGRLGELLQEQEPKAQQEKNLESEEDNSSSPDDQGYFEKPTKDSASEEDNFIFEE